MFLLRVAGRPISVCLLRGGVCVCARSLDRRGKEWSRPALLAFFVTFDVPSAVMALAPDLVMLLPHLAAVYLASRKRPFASGVVAGAALLANPKGVFVLAAAFSGAGASGCRWRPDSQSPMDCARRPGDHGALQSYYQQVWQWGALYSRDSFIDHPIVEGLRRTSAWLGFHAAIVLAAALVLVSGTHVDAKRFALWAVLALVGVVLGWRFFPRYYFLLLPALVLAAARGFRLLSPSTPGGFRLLLLIPLVRFGPRYVTLAD